jgi:hypothetical protein
MDNTVFEDHISELYCIVGDDLVVFDEILKNRIIDLYLILGVDISLPKSKIPVGQDIFTEFCSRTSINNTDVSRVPPNLIREASKNFRSFPLLIKEMVKRNIQPDMTRLPSYLNKVNSEGKTYLSQLKVILTLPILGTDLSAFSKDIDCTVNVEREGIMREVVYTIHLLKALEKVDSANDVFTGIFQFGNDQ